jgi:hypothetical protein
MTVRLGRMPSSQVACASALWLSTALMLIVFAGALRAQERPSRAEQEAFLAETRRTVLEYDRSLPGFLCTVTIRRYETVLANMVRGTSVAEHFSGAVTATLSYYQGNERYTAIAVNGFKPATSYAPMGGMISTGEFGTVLRRTFDGPAALEFVKWTAFRSRKAAIYSFQLDASAKTYQIRTWDSRGQPAPGAVVGLRGVLCIDAETHSVLRLSYESDGVPHGFPVAATSTTVEYDYAEISGRRYLLPSKANVRIAVDMGERRNEVTFKSYRESSSKAAMEFENKPAEAK